MGLVHADLQLLSCFQSARTRQSQVLAMSPPQFPLPVLSLSLVT